MSDAQLQNCDGSHWNQFFSGLAHAENAAAKSCESLSAAFGATGNTLLEGRYRDFANEEQGHFESIKSLCSPICPPTPRAQAIFSRELMETPTSTLETLVIVHLVFEPSALGYLGFLYRNSATLFPDENRASEIRKVLLPLITEETAHVLQGTDLIRTLWQSESEEGRRKIKRSIRKHRAFLRLGIQSFFSQVEELKRVVPKLLDSYDKQFGHYFTEVTY